MPFTVDETHGKKTDGPTALESMSETEAAQAANASLVRAHGVVFLSSFTGADDILLVSS